MNQWEVRFDDENLQWDLHQSTENGWRSNGVIWTEEDAKSIATKLNLHNELVVKLKELLRVDDEWHGSVNEEMAAARKAARDVLTKAT